jgi:SAM-dependent methyltransferase
MSPTSPPAAPAPWTRRRLFAAKRAVRERTVRELRDRIAVRRRLAARHLRGHGLEVGALQLPLPLPRDARARYVDRAPVAQLRADYPELALYDLVEPDVLDDGQVLGTVPDASQDFVVANHLIEHTEDPLGTLRHHLRVLRPGGTLFWAVPDGRRTFDRDRPVTPLAHLRRDHDEGPAWSRRAHYEEWAALVNRVPADEVAGRADELQDAGYPIHFHVFTPESFAGMLLWAREHLALALDLEAIERNGHEFVVVARRG